ncbi:MAG TPA: bifunctional molybdenum cofactor biosynthesis protein MoaC/MoaB [Nitrososphaera sp.]|nr:bifunctional molybdenum cofactor biosynthesis protein MoaC/MoaB [Nitrososphaera sp.]
MFDVSHKPDTARYALARATLRVKEPATIRVIRGQEPSPKGNVLEAARVAGTMAAKSTSDILPYCHVMPIDFVRIDFSFEDDDSLVVIDGEVKSIWKTGVEMEALTGVTIAALTIYDMVKPLGDALQIEGIKLLQKSGGLGEEAHKTTASIRDALGKRGAEKKLQVAVIVMSDSRTKDEDESGRLIIDRLTSSYLWRNNALAVLDYKVIPDDATLIESELRRLSDEKKADLVLTSGGTGIGPHDVTPEATSRVIDIELKGVSEALRSHGQRRTPAAMLSRGVAGIRKGTIIVNLPGSARAVSESLDVLFPTIVHAFEILRGAGHNDGDHSHQPGSKERGNDNSSRHSKH